MGYEQLPAPAFLQEKFEEGHRWEGAILRRSAANLGMTIVPELDGSQYEIVIPVGSRAAIRGHIDAIFEDEDEKRYGFEAKALGPDYFATLKRKGLIGIPHYAAQHACYEHGMPELESWYFGVQDKEHPETEPWVFEVPEPVVDINELKAKVALVEAGVRAGKDFTEFEYYSHGFCSYWYLHPDSAAEEVRITTNELIDTLSKTYADAKDEEKQAKTKVTAVRLQLIEAMKGQEKVVTEDWEVKISTVTQYRFSQQAAIEELGVEAIERFKRPSEYVKVSVKEREGG